MHLTPQPKGAMTGFKVGSLAALGDKFPSTGNSITFEDGHGVLQLSNGQTVKVRRESSAVCASHALAPPV
jgi:hypothetical protein